jgi:hypothetical protein
MMNLYEALKSGSTVAEIQEAFTKELEAAQVKLQEENFNVQKEKAWQDAVEHLASWYRQYEGMACETLRKDAKIYFDAAMRNAYNKRYTMNPIDEFLAAHGL